MLNLIDGGFVPGTELPLGGTMKRLCWINFEELDFSSGNPYTLDGTQKIINVAMAATKVAYEFKGFRTDVKKSVEVITPGLGPNQLKHLCGFVVCDRTQEKKNLVEKLMRSKGIVIVENIGADADAWELIGAKSGVEMVAGAIQNAHENGGYFTLNFATMDGEFETKLPQTLGGSYADGLTLINALIAG